MPRMLALVAIAPYVASVLFFYVKYFLLQFPAGCGGWQVGFELIFFEAGALLWLVGAVIISLLILGFKKQIAGQTKWLAIREFCVLLARVFFFTTVALFLFLATNVGGGGCI